LGLPSALLAKSSTSLQSALAGSLPIAAFSNSLLHIGQLGTPLAASHASFRQLL
jgi:hypothetical protein